ELATPLSLEQKRQIYFEISNHVAKNYRDSDLSNAIDTEIFSAKKKPKDEKRTIEQMDTSQWSGEKSKKYVPFVSKKSVMPSKQFDELINYLNSYSKTGEIKYLELARQIRVQYATPTDKFSLDRLNHSAIGAKSRAAEEDLLSASDFGRISMWINFLTINAEEMSDRYEEPFELSDFQFAPIVPQEDIQSPDLTIPETPTSVATSNSQPTTNEPVANQTAATTSTTLQDLSTWINNTITKLSTQRTAILEQELTPEKTVRLEYIENSLTSLKNALNRIPTIESRLPRSLFLHQLTGIKDFIEQFADDPERRAGRFIEPTGAGKTTIYGAIALIFGWKTIILTHRENLLKTIRNELIDGVGFDKEDITILEKDRPAADSQIIIGTYAGHRAALKRADSYTVDLKNAELIVCDEGHRALGKETTKTLHKLARERNLKTIKNLSHHVGEKTWRIAMTATPDLSRKSVATAFPHLIHRSSYKELVAAGVIKKFKVVQSPVTLKPHEVPRGMTTRQEVTLLRQKRVHESLLTSFCETRDKVPEKLYAFATCLTIAECDRLKKMAEEDFGLKCAIITSREMKGKRKVDSDQKTPLEIAEEQLANGEIDMIISAEKLREGWDYRRLNAVLQVMASQSPARVLQPPGRASRRFEDQEYAYIFEPSWIGLTNVKIGGGTSTKAKSPRQKREASNEKDPLLIPAPTNSTPLTFVDALELLGEDDVDTVCETLEGKPLKRYRLLPVDKEGRITIDGIPCIALIPYCELKGLDYSSLSRLVLSEKIQARGYARLETGRAVPVYQQSQIESLEYVQKYQSKPEISVDESGLVTTETGIKAIGIARFVAANGMDYETFERHLKAAEISPLGKALSGDKIVDIYPYDRVAKLRYVAEAIANKDKIINNKGFITLNGIRCCGINSFAEKNRLDAQILTDEVSDKKLEVIGKAKAAGGQIIDVYSVEQLRKLPYVKKSLKTRKLPQLDKETGEVQIKEVICTSIKRFATLNGLSHILLAEDVEANKLKARGEARALNAPVKVYSVEDLRALPYCKRLSLPKLAKENKTGIIKIEGVEYIAINRYAKYLKIESDELAKEITATELTSEVQVSANGQIIFVYPKKLVDKIPYVKNRGRR
nr:DEAD/DEAH box helicase family protein [Pseudomonadota bacterium]